MDSVAMIKRQKEKMLSSVIDCYGSHNCSHVWHYHVSRYSTCVKQYSEGEKSFPFKATAKYW